jgi:outer membrane protein assembly factor BamB
MYAMRQRPIARRPGTPGGLAAALLLAAGLALALPAHDAHAQQAAVYIDDSVTAAESFDRLPDLLASGNLGEALRVSQRLLDEEGDRLVTSTWDPAVFVSVRDRVHTLLLGDATLLARYRQLEGPRAETLAKAGDFAELERARLLTEPGLDAVLRLAQRDLEAARFDGAALRLRQSLTHPDLRGERAIRAAELAVLITRYTRSRTAADLAAALAQAAGAPEPKAVPINPPPRALERTPEPGADQGPLDTASITPEPLATAPLALFAKGRVMSDRLVLPWSIPAAAGEFIYTNDGVTVSAWDRWTLTPAWSFAAAQGDDPESGGFPEMGGFNALEATARALEDTTGVSVGSGAVLAATGFAVSNARRHGDARVHALDPRTGAPLWSVTLASLDRQLIEATVRGPILIVNDTAVLAADRFSAGRRLATSMLVGLDVSTGRLRWIRTLANMGLPPIGQVSRPADRPVQHDGVVYHTDSLGVVAAVDAASGRFLWLHRLASGAGVDEMGRAYYGVSRPPPWLGISVLIDGSSILTVEPGSGDIVRLSRADGRIVARRAGDPREGPRTLLRINADTLAAVGSSGINFLPTSDLIKGVAREVAMPPGAGMIGMPVPSGGSLLVPVGRGLLVTDPKAPDRPKMIDLPASGHPVLSEGRLLVASTFALQSFQSWESMEPRLLSAIRAKPKDPTPALAYLKVALRAGRSAGIAPVAEKLLAVLDADPIESSEARRTLFETIRGAINGARLASEHPLDAESKVPPSAVSLEQTEALLALLGRAADSPAERAEHLLLASWSEVSRSRTSAGIEACQAILQDPNLASALVRSWDLTTPGLIPGSLAARTRLGAILAAAGYEAYAGFEAQASAEAAAVRTPDDALALSTRYPASRAAIAVLDQAAQRLLEEGDATRAMTLLGKALDTGRLIGAATKQSLIPESFAPGSRLVGLLAKADRPGEASRLARELARAGSPPPDADLASIERSLAQREARPRLGTAIESRASVVAGWTPLIPVLAPDAGSAGDQVAMISPGSGHVGVWARRPEDDRLAPLWTRPIPADLPAPPSVVRVGWNETYLSWPGPRGPSVECVATDGTTAWRTPPLATILPPEDPAAPPGPVLVVPDDSTLVLIRKATGHAAAFDRATGTALWSKRLEASSIRDATATNGVLAVLGDQEIPGKPRLAIHDLKTGAATIVLGDDQAPLDGVPRWLRPLGDGFLVGVSDSLWSIRASNGTRNWKISGEAAERTTWCWIVGNRAFVLAEDGSPWMFDPRSDAPEPITLDSNAGLRALGRDRDLDSSSTMVHSSRGGTIAVVTPQGLTVFAPDGKVVGADALPANEGPYFTAVADRQAVFLSSPGEPDREGKRDATLRLLELPSGRIVREQSVALYDPVMDLRLVDGTILIATGTPATPMTLVLDAPLVKP